MHRGAEAPEHRHDLSTDHCSSQPHGDGCGQTHDLQIRVVLAWGANPPDLDVRLVTPRGACNPCVARFSLACCNQRLVVSALQWCAVLPMCRLRSVVRQPALHQRRAGPAGRRLDTRLRSGDDDVRPGRLWQVLLHGQQVHGRIASRDERQPSRRPGAALVLSRRFCRSSALLHA